MGKRGPRPTPSPVLSARGSDVPQRRKKAGAPVPVFVNAPCEITAPIAFDGVPTQDQALDVVCRAINDAGTMMKGGEVATDILARALVDYHRARQAVREFSEINPLAAMDGKQAYTYSVLNAAYSNASNTLWKNIREFGLTPASIAEVSKPEPKKVANEGPQKAPLKRGA